MTEESAGMPPFFPSFPLFFRHSREGGNPDEYAPFFPSLPLFFRHSRRGGNPEDDALAYFSLIQTMEVGGRGAGRPPPAEGATVAGSGTGPRLFRT